MKNKPMKQNLSGGRRSRGAATRLTNRDNQSQPTNDVLPCLGSAGASYSLPKRQHPVHGVFTPNGESAIVSITVCTKFRRPWLANKSVHELLKKTWRKADLRRVGRYVIMPDHIHLFAGEYGDIQLDNWIRYWKSQFTKLHNDKNCLWQTDHWDRRIRSDAKYEEAWNYIFWNPVRAKLVTELEQWPFAGSIFEIPWD